MRMITQWAEQSLGPKLAQAKWMQDLAKKTNEGIIFVQKISNFKNNIQNFLT